jgi:acyl carrier protein
MDLNQFVENFSAQLDNEEGLTIEPLTAFRNLPEWGSLTALTIIAMADEKYDVKLTGDDIRNSNTVSDLYEKVKTKI